MTGPESIPVDGVQGLDHTADVGLLVSAPDLPTLFERAARGSLWLVLERDPQAPARVADGPGSAPAAGPDQVPDQDRLGQAGSPDSSPNRPVELVEEDLPMLLRSWLRTLLLWAETDGYVATSFSIATVPAPLCSAEDGQAFALRGRVEGVMDLGPREREIKGVTFHGLEVVKEGDGWRAQVIFDV